MCRGVRLQKMFELGMRDDGLPKNAHRFDAAAADQPVNAAVADPENRCSLFDGVRQFGRLEFQFRQVCSYKHCLNRG